jgi:DNA-binding GntR family transcriptional regulator
VFVTTVPAKEKLPVSVTDAVRRAIVTGRYRPGERLTEDQLADEYGVSRVPVREALRSLEGEGFVRLAPYSGTFVAELSEVEAEDLLEVRAAIEVVAARRAAARRTPEQLAELRAIVKTARSSLQAGDYDRLVELNGRFHLVLAQASGNPSIHQLLQQLRAKIEWVYAADVRDRARASWKEHAELLDALEVADEDESARLTEIHIRNARAAYCRRRDPSSSGTDQ